MNFFCTKKHFIEWAEKNARDTTDLFALPLPEAIVVAQWVFGLED